MFLKISEIVPKYSNYCFSERISYWFNVNTYEFYDEERLAEFGYDVSDYEHLKLVLTEQGIIPSYCPNLYEFDKQYIESFRNKKLSERFAAAESEEQYHNWVEIFKEQEISFACVPDSKDFYTESMIKWCEENQIRYEL